MNEYAFTERSVESKRILYSPSNFAKEDLLHLQETGTLSAIKPHKSHRSHLKSYLMFVILHGSGQLTYEDEIYNVKDGDCVFIDCNKPYSHSTGDDLWTLEWVHFDGRSMEGIYGKYRERGGRPVFRPKSKIPFAEILNKIYDTAAGDDFMRDMRLNEQLSSLLTMIMENSWVPENQKTRASTSSENILGDVKDYIDIHYRERISLDKLSEEFFINKFYLVRLFKSTYGDTIINYQTSQKIANAKRLLRFSEKSIEEAGYDSGFEDPNYFSRTFKKAEGYTPSDYRNMWREK